jgi:hypothetical protein
MLTYVLYTKQHVGQHSPAPVSHIYVDMLNLYPVLLVIRFVYNM